MEQSASIAALAAALSAAQGEFPPIKRNKEATIPTRGGGSYKYAYADLNDMIEQLRPVLAKNGLSVNGGPADVSIQDWHTDEGIVPVLMVRVETQLSHSSGEWQRIISTIACRSLDAQSMGSAITYARRYGYGAITGIAPDTDDDGGAATRPADAPQPRQGGARSGQPTPTGAAAGEFKWPFGPTQNKGKALKDLPMKFLSWTQTDQFDKADIKATVAEYLKTVCSEDDLWFLIYAAYELQPKVDPDKVKAQVEAQKAKGHVPHVFYEAAIGVYEQHSGHGEVPELRERWDAMTEDERTDYFAEVPQ